MVPELKKEEILKSIKKRDVSYIRDLAAGLSTSLSTVRKDVTAPEQGGGIIVMRGDTVKYRAEDLDEPVVEKKPIHNEEKETVARRVAALMENGDCVYMDSGTTTVRVLKYPQGRRITIVSSSTELLGNLLIRNVKCIPLEGGARDGLESVLSTLAEKMISDIYFDKTLIGANGYIPDRSIYTYDDREARKKVIVKDHSKVVHVLMGISKKSKYSFSKMFDLGEAILITEEEDNKQRTYVRRRGQAGVSVRTGNAAREMTASAMQGS